MVKSKALVSDINEINYFNLRMDEDTTIIIDGASIFHSARSLGIEVDYKKIRNYFDSRCMMRRALYYSVLKVEDEDDIEGGEYGGEKFNPVKRLLDFLSYNGYSTVIKHKYIAPEKPDDFRKPYVGSMLVEIATDIMVHAQFSPHIVIFGGSNDLAYTVNAAKAKFGTKFTGCSVINQRDATKTLAMGDDFRRSVDISVDLGSRHIKDMFEKIREINEVPAFISEPRRRVGS